MRAFSMSCPASSTVAPRLAIWRCLSELAVSPATTVMVTPVVVRDYAAWGEVVGLFEQFAQGGLQRAVLYARADDDAPTVLPIA
jgi:hypothetical protein